MNRPLLVSIVINNYNYGRFLGQAIDSALRQNHEEVEVIVVDDGSIDNSREVITGYGQKIIPVLKENEGQASALNAGFACSHGSVVIFLDADDMLRPETAGVVASVFREKPETTKVQYRLEIIDAGGGLTGLFKPPRLQTMPQGDLRRKLLAFPDDIPWQPTSGNAFAAWVLKLIFPVPEASYRICADYYLSNLPALFGPVVSLEEVGGYYRVHNRNNHYSSAVDLEQVRQNIIRTCKTHHYIKQAADTIGLKGFPDQEDRVPSVTFLANRMVSMKLDPQNHPLHKDRPISLLLLGLRASIGRFDLVWSRRLLNALWFGAVFVAPRPLVKWLAAQFFYPEQRVFGKNGL
jgi:glycosyltransferase involved in cell wall biosynthesis